MPEIWLNYGADEAVLEIMAENLARTIKSGSSPAFGASDADSGDASDHDGPVEGGISNGNGNDDDSADGGADGGTAPGLIDPENGKNNGDTQSANAGGITRSDDAAGDTAAVDNNNNDIRTGTDGNAGGSNADSDPPLHSGPVTSHATTNTARTDPVFDSNDIVDRLGSLDLSKSFDLVLMHDSQAVRQVVSSIFMMCERRSVPFPGILADKHTLSSVKSGLPEGSVLEEFVSRTLDASVLGGDAGSVASGISSTERTSTGVDNQVPDAGAIVDAHKGRPDAAQKGSNNTDPPREYVQSSADAQTRGRGLVFVAETEFDGLFGYETVATRLVRRFGADEMLAAYAKRGGNAPSPGRRAGSLDVATRFADRFEVACIDVVASSQGISDLFVGHPSNTTRDASASLESLSILDVEPQKAMIISTGKPSSSATLGDAFSSIWNCCGAVRSGGLCVLAAECGRGLGSDAARMHIEGLLDEDILQNPPVYVDGMEDVLFLQDVKKRCQVALVSILPEMYTDKLGIVSIGGLRDAVDYIKKTQGARQKAAVIEDGSRLLLR